MKPDRRRIWDWAAEHVWLPSGVLSVTGRFDVSRSRQFIEILDELQNDRRRVVTLMKPIRQGGSLIADIWLPWTIANCPGSFMWNLQEGNTVSHYAEQRIMPLLELCPPVAELFPQKRHRKRKEAIIFKNGVPLSIQACTLTNLQSRGVRYQVNDEVWLWPEGRLKQALGRLGEFEDIELSKAFIVSQGGMDGDELDQHYNAGDQREWHIECQGCHQFFIPKSYGFREDGSRWGLIWDVNEKTKNKATGLWQLEALQSSVRYECPECAFPHLNVARTQTEWNRTGRYVAGNTHNDPANVSFHWYASIARQWAKLAVQLAHAENALKQGILDPFINYVQKRDARSFSQKLLLELTPTRRVVYEIASEWPDEFVRLMTVDKQSEGVYWVVIRAWAKDGRSRRLWWGKLYGWGEVRAKQEEFKVEDCKTLIDASFESKGTDGVYAACCRYGWLSLKGTNKRKAFIHSYGGTDGGPRAYIEKSYSEQQWGDPESGTAQEGTRFAPLVIFAKDTVNERLQRIRQTDLWMDPQIAPDEMEHEYREQMAAEYPQTRRDPLTGFVSTVWVCPSGNNHAWDCEGMQIVGATILTILPDTFEEPADPQPVLKPAN